MSKLEFFGDSILRSVIDDCLIDQFPEYNEEQLSVKRDQLVSKNGKLYQVAEKLILDRFICAGKGESALIFGEGRKKILTSVMEAIIGAVFIDCEKDYSVIKWFIGEHFDFDVQSHKDQSLFNAVEDANLKRIQFWLNNGADPNNPQILKKRIGGTPFYMCLIKGEEGFFGNLDSFVSGNVTSSTLEAAVMYNEFNRNTVKIIKYLLQFGADLNNAFHRFLLQEIITYDMRKFCGELTIALEEGRPDGLFIFNPKYVPSISWSETIRNEKKLVICRSSEVIYGQKLLNEIFFWLCEYGADPNVCDRSQVTNVASVRYFTPLCVAAISGDKDKVKILLKYKADPNLSSFMNKMPLHEAAIRCYGTRSKLFTNIIKQLLKANADPNATRASLLLATSNHKQISSENFEKIFLNNNHLFSKPSKIDGSAKQKQKAKSYDISVDSTHLSDDNTTHSLLLFSKNTQEAASTILVTEENALDRSATYKYLCTIS